MCSALSEEASPQQSGKGREGKGKGPSLGWFGVLEHVRERKEEGAWKGFPSC